MSGRRRGRLAAPKESHRISRARTAAPRVEEVATQESPASSAVYINGRHPSLADGVIDSVEEVRSNYEALSGPCVLSLAVGVAQQVSLQLGTLSFGMHFPNTGAGRTMMLHDIAETYDAAFDIVHDAVTQLLALEYVLCERAHVAADNLRERYASDPRHRPVKPEY